MAAALVGTLALFSAAGALAVYPDPVTVGFLVTPCAGVPDGGGSFASTTLAAAVADSVFWNFNAVKLITSPSEIDSRKKLDDLGIDVLMYFGSGTYSTSLGSTVNDAIDQWVLQSGGGLVTGPGIQSMGAGPSVVPVVLNGNVGFCNDVTNQNRSYWYSISVTQPAHEAVAQLPVGPQEAGGALAWCPGGVASAGSTFKSVTSVAQYNVPAATLSASGLDACGFYSFPFNTAAASQAFVVAEAGAGRVAYLGQYYCGITFYNARVLRGGMPDRVLENALRWASGGTGTPEESSDASAPGATTLLLVALAAFSAISCW
jgi:hypothetical protein